MSNNTTKMPPGIVLVQSCDDIVTRHRLRGISGIEYLTWRQVMTLPVEILSVFFQGAHETFLEVNILGATEFRQELLAKLHSAGSVKPRPILSLKPIFDFFKQPVPKKTKAAQPEIVIENKKTGRSMNKVCIVGFPSEDFGPLWQNSPDIVWLPEARLADVSLGRLAKENGVTHCILSAALNKQWVAEQEEAFAKHRARDNLIKVEKKQQVVTALFSLNVRTGKAPSNGAGSGTTVPPVPPERPLVTPHLIIYRDFKILLVGFKASQLSAEVLACPRVIVFNGTDVPHKIGVVIHNRSNRQVWDNMSHMVDESLTSDCILETTTAVLTRDWQSFIAGCEKGVDELVPGNYEVLVIGASYADFEGHGKGELYKSPRILQWGFGQISDVSLIPTGIKHVLFIDTKPSKASTVNNLARTAGLSQHCTQFYACTKLVEALEQLLNPADGDRVDVAAGGKKEGTAPSGALPAGNGNGSKGGGGGRDGSGGADEPQGSTAHLDAIPVQDFLLTKEGFKPLFDHFGTQATPVEKYLNSRGVTTLTNGAIYQRLCKFRLKVDGHAPGAAKKGAAVLVASGTAKEMLEMIPQLEEFIAKAKQLAKENEQLRAVVASQEADLADLPRLREAEADFNKAAQFFLKRAN